MVAELKSDHAQQRIGVGDADEAPIKASSLCDQKKHYETAEKVKGDDSTLGKMSWFDHGSPEFVCLEIHRF